MSKVQLLAKKDEPVLKATGSNRGVYHQPDPEVDKLSPACASPAASTYMVEERWVLDERSSYRPCQRCFSEGEMSDG